MKIDCLKCHKEFEQSEMDMPWTKLGKISKCPHCKNTMTMIRTPRNLKKLSNGQYVKKFPGAK